MSSEPTFTFKAFGRLLLRTYTFSIKRYSAKNSWRNWVFLAWFLAVVFTTIAYLTFVVSLLAAPKPSELTSVEAFASEFQLSKAIGRVSTVRRYILLSIDGEYRRFTTWEKAFISKACLQQAYSQVQHEGGRFFAVHLDSMRLTELYRIETESGRLLCGHSLHEMRLKQARSIASTKRLLVWLGNIYKFLLFIPWCFLLIKVQGVKGE